MVKVVWPVIIDDVIENEIESHKATESSHEATTQTENELLRVEENQQDMDILQN